MRNYDNESLLEMVELYAADNQGHITCEEELSDRFDEDMADVVIAAYGTDDAIAMNEEFDNWSDALCKEGEIHPEQYNNYCYVGKYSD